MPRSPSAVKTISTAWGHHRDCQLLCPHRNCWMIWIKEIMHWLCQGSGYLRSQFVKAQSRVYHLQIRLILQQCVLASSARKIIRGRRAGPFLSASALPR